MAKDMLEVLADSEGFAGLEITARPLAGDSFLAGSLDTKRFAAFVRAAGERPTTLRWSKWPSGWDSLSKRLCAV